MAAAREIVVLSSSPPRTIPDSDIIVTPLCLRERLPSSPPSPDLPSLPDLLKSKPSGLKSGSRAAEIPNGATLGFGTVASLLKERRILLGEENDADLPEACIGKKPPPKSTKAVRKPRTTLPALDETAKSTKPAAQEEDKDGAKGKRKAKAPKPRQPRTTKVLETAAKDGMGTTEDGVKHDAEAHREPSAVGALKKRRAKSKPGVSDPLSAQVHALATEDVLATTEPAAIADEFRHESILPKLQKSKGRPKKSEGVEAAETKSGKASKPRQKKTAPDEKKQAKKAPKAKKATTAVSTHFSRETSREIAAELLPKSPKSNPVDAPLDLDHAIERRRSWTPTKDTTFRASIEISDSPSEPPVSSGQRANQNQFASLLGGFGYQKSPQQGANVEGRAETGEAFTKRRKLEMIPNPVQSAAHATKKLESGTEKPTKEKALVKKKPKTITELATAAYRAPPAETTIAVDNRVSEFFVPRPCDVSSEKPNETGSAPPEKSKRARQKSPSKASIEKARKTTEKAKKQAKLAANKLLSPGAALLKYNDQEVLFGTSSQLVHEGSPTFGRQIQQALRESEAASMQATSPETLGLQNIAEDGGLSLLDRRKGLWNAAARNLLDETFDVYDPGAEEYQTVGDYPGSPLPDIANGEAHPRAQPRDPSPDFVDIDEYDDLTKRCSETSATVMNVDLPAQSPPRSSLRPPVVQIRSPSSSTMNIPLHAAPRDTTLPLQRSSGPKQLSGARAISTSTADRSRTAGLVASRSATDPSIRAAQKGSKAPRALPQGLISIPNALLPDARVSEFRREGHVTTRNELPQGLITPPKRSGRKKAKKDEGWVHIDEIEDSEEEITPSPPRRRKVPSETPKLRLIGSGNKKDAAAIPPAPRGAPSKRVSSLPSEEQLAEVFPIITDAIKASPPSVRPRDPSWHERILLYDPVVVEDLSEWLNRRGVRIRMEVAVKVKKTKKRRGNKTADAESGEEVAAAQSGLEVKEVPLQPWIVQRWCEEHSVCCIWKDNENKRKGWKARTG